ncbi:hypothetical protein SKAU_G00094640 [Synaphobranchus kaupii]|uniref:Fibronectin type-III domain-containing protein n=1 Tax=Synaphobranchus kaupii TaxID=118154 RepID=A0A9Q1J6T1_SYNKA|nr:hypothetical protein SKAU_G00094640 [Synaphobranchus kaupii]
MYQVQYNSTSDDTLVYRMIPSTSQDFLVKDLVSGREYDLCVLAVYNEGFTSLTATRQVGCVQFITEMEYNQCQSVPSHFLGGTMIIIIGGIIVASVLVFIIILMIRYKVYSHQGGETGKSAITNVLSGRQGRSPGLHPRGAEGQEEQVLTCSGVGVGAVSVGAAPTTTIKESNTMTLVVDCEKVQITEMSAENIRSPTQMRQSRTCIELKRTTSLTAKEAKSGEAIVGTKNYKNAQEIPAPSFSAL